MHSITPLPAPYTPSMHPLLLILEKEIRKETANLARQLSVEPRMIVNKLPLRLTLRSTAYFLPRIVENRFDLLLDGRSRSPALIARSSAYICLLKARLASIVFWVT